jgi:primosomal protein N' (replication factor Y)
LLWGVTGSGKTEIYLQLIAQALKKKESVLVLVPEIALTPLLWERFEKRFPGEIALFHSAQKEKEIRNFIRRI